MNLADEIKKRFTPFAFTCECKGTHPDCNNAINNDVYAIAQNDTVTRIVEFIETFKDVLTELDELHFEIKSKNGPGWCFQCQQDWPCGTYQTIHRKEL
jgi:hypothetical protein